MINKNLKALANGKELVDSNNNILHIEQVILFTANTDDVGTEYTLEQLNELEIYVNPLQEKIDAMITKNLPLLNESSEGKYPLMDDYIAIVKAGIVVTVLNKKERK